MHGHFYVAMPAINAVYYLFYFLNGLLQERQSADKAFPAYYTKKKVVTQFCVEFDRVEENLLLQAQK